MLLIKDLFSGSTRLNIGHDSKYYLMFILYQFTEDAVVLLEKYEQGVNARWVLYPIPGLVNRPLKFVLCNRANINIL